MWENTDQNNSQHGHFSRSEILGFSTWSNFVEYFREINLRYHQRCMCSKCCWWQCIVSCQEGPKSLINVLENESNEVIKWFRGNDMFINPDKFGLSKFTTYDPTVQDSRVQDSRINYVFRCMPLTDWRCGTEISL